MRGYRGVAVLLVGMLVAAGTASAAPLKATVRAPATAIAGTEWQAQVTVTRAGKRVRGLTVTVRATRGSATRAAPARPVGPASTARGCGSRSSDAGRTRPSFAAGSSPRRGQVRRASRLRPPPPPAPPPPPPRYVTRAPSVGAVFTMNVANGPQVHPHDIWPAGDGASRTRASSAGSSAGLSRRAARSAVRSRRLRPTAWSRDRQRRVGRRHGPKLDHPRGSRNRGDHRYPSPALQRRSPRRDLGRRRSPLVHRIEGYVGRVDPSKPPAQAVTVSPRRGATARTGSTRRRRERLVRLVPHQQLPRANRSRDRGGDRRRPRARDPVPARLVYSQGRLWASECGGPPARAVQPGDIGVGRWAIPAGDSSLGYAITVDAADVRLGDRLRVQPLVGSARHGDLHFRASRRRTPRSGGSSATGPGSGTRSSLDRVILHRAPSTTGRRSLVSPGD